MVKVYKSDELKTKVYQSYDRLLNQWNIDFVEQDIDTTYGKTHVIKCGKPKNKPLFMFHGVGDNSALMWIYNAKALSEHFYIIAVDTIGGPGKSIPNKNYNQTFNQIKWLDELLDYFLFEKVNLCGVSNGAYLAQLYSIKRPERAVKCVCMAGILFTKKASNPMLKMIKVFFQRLYFQL